MDQKELMQLLGEAQNAPVSYVDLKMATRRIKVDMDTRKINGHKEFGVIKDHLAEHIIFEVKRYKGDTDLAEKHCAIHWENGKNGGVVPVTEIDLSEDGHILMRWELSDEFTQYAGSIAYALHFFSILDGGFTYHAATNAAVGTLGTTLNASAHSKNKITPSEIEVYIAKMNELSAAMDEQVVLAQEAATKAESIAEQLAEKIAKVEELTQKTEINKNDISKLSGDIEAYTSPLKAWTEVEADEVYDNKLFNLVDKNEVTNTEIYVKTCCYIKVSIPNHIKHIKVSGESANATYNFDLGAFYTESGELISKFGNDNETVYTDLEVEVPQHASYVIVNQRNISGEVYKKVVFYDVVPFFERIECIEQNISLITEKEADEVHDGKVFNLVNQNVAKYNGCYTKTKIPNGINKIWVSGESANATYNFDLGAFYTESGELISKFGNDNETVYTDLEVEVPQHASYVIVNQVGSNAGDYKKIKHHSIRSLQEEYKKVYSEIKRVEQTFSPLLSTDVFDGIEFSIFKKWGLIGDSLSVGYTKNADGTQAYGRNIYYSWGQYLARKIGNTCLNFGASGLSAKTWMSSEYGYNRLIRSENLCQCYIVGLGANDTDMPLGSISDINFDDMTQNADTEYGWYAKVINAIRSISSEAPIFLFTLPYPRNTDVNIQDINEMIRTLASDEHFDKVYVVDLDSEYNSYFRSGKLFDQIGNTGWHLTSLGYLYASRVNEMALSKVIADNYGEFQDVFLLPYGSTESLD